MFLGKTFHSHSVYLHPGVQVYKLPLGVAMLRRNPEVDLHCIFLRLLKLEVDSSLVGHFAQMLTIDNNF